MNPTINQHENIKNNNLAQPRNKKAAPISLITGTETIFIKGKINNVATSYFESSQKIQNFYKVKNTQIKKDTLKKISKPKLNHFKYSTSAYNNTFNVSVGNTIHDNKKNIIKISNINENNDKLNPPTNLNSTRLNRNKNNTIIKEEIDSYKLMKSNTNNNLSKDYNNGKKSSNKSLRQIRQNVKKTISMIVHKNSIGKNKDKNSKKSIKKNITYCNNYLNNQVYKKEFDISKERSLEKKKNNIKNQNIEKPKKTLKQFIIKKKIDVKSKINEIKETEIIKPNTTMNKSNISITYKININYHKNSNNKSTAITTSRTETSCEKKYEEKKDVIKKKLPLNKTNNNLNLLSLIQENNKKGNNNSKEKNRINDSFDKKENSFENIQNVLSNNMDLLNDKKFIEFDNFDDLNSIVKKLHFHQIEKDTISIFSVKNNLKYEMYIKNFTKVIEYNSKK